MTNSDQKLTHNIGVQITITSTSNDDLRTATEAMARLPPEIVINVTEFWRGDELWDHGDWEPWMLPGWMDIMLNGANKIHPITLQARVWTDDRNVLASIVEIAESMPAPALIRHADALYESAIDISPDKIRAILSPYLSTE